MELVFCFWNDAVICFSGPDENPSDVKAAGREPDNLVISWRVRSLQSLHRILLEKMKVTKCYLSG